MCAQQPRQPACAALLRAGAEHALHALLPSTAVFLAERLVAAAPSAASAQLLARAHGAAGAHMCAAAALRPFLHAGEETRYLYAACLVRAGGEKGSSEVEVVLLGRGAGGGVAGGAAGCYLLGVVCQRTGRKAEAEKYYRRALEGNPCLWAAAEALAGMGCGGDYLGEIGDQEALDLLEKQPRFGMSGAWGKDGYEGEREKFAYGGGGGGGGGGGVPSTPVVGGGRKGRARFTTPSPGGGQNMTPAVPGAPVRRGIGIGGGRMRGNGGGGVTATPAGAGRSGGGFLGGGGGGAGDVRRSARLFATPTPDNRNASAVSRILGAAATPVGGGEVVKVEKKAEWGSNDADMDAMDLLRRLLKAIGALGQFKGDVAVKAVEMLPEVQRKTGFICGVVGRAYLESGDYAAAEVAFIEAMRLNPIRLEGIVEYYSTVLWHMKKETELAELAISAFGIDRHTAATWCAVGNCYSGQRDPDTALRYFKRATRVDPHNAYAHTLAGHEFAVKEDFDSALASYRQALVIDDRHYNALYGIGQVLQKQEKFVLAARHFRAALRIHPKNSNLHYHLGVALAAAAGNEPGKAALGPALCELEAATALDPKNPVPKFERARLLTQMDRLSDARVLLENLRDSLPKEAAVYHELGKVCKRMGDRKAALSCFSNALDIDPKDQGRRYKKAIDTVFTE